AGESAYHRGDHARAATYAEAGLALSQDDHGRWICLSTLSVLALARQEFAAAIDLSLEAHELASEPRDNLGIAGLAAAYAGDLEHAVELNERGGRSAVSPTMLGWTAYVRGEILTAGGDRKAAGPHYTEAIDLARTSGARFVEGIATVGLQGTLAEAGQLDDALRGYREVVEYFARTGNWSHLGETLRNLAQLLSTIDDEAAAELRAAADDTRRGLEIARRHLDDKIASAS
ncbi:MAG TPA: transcriptional regulator, partial [Candidatus Limnocylindria bacterium]|nr:transcriptional regulator [Candidatus Limnocylindria bacterium]